MLKFVLIAAAGLSAAALSLNAPASAARINACDVSSKVEFIQWSQSHPGQSYMQACAAQGGE